MNKYIKRFKNIRILVVGDIILDKYIWGNVSRISPEAPVPVVEVENETITLGGAANVVHNLATLGAKPILCGVIGADIYGGSVLTHIDDLKVDMSCIIADPSRPTTIKTRVVGNNTQIVRFDSESTKQIGDHERKAVLKAVENSIDSIDGIIISDYNKGVISSPLLHDIKEIVNGSSVFIVSDPHKNNFYPHKYVNVITPNTEEAGHYCGFTIKDEKDLEYVGKKMLHDLRCTFVLITRSEKGMTLFKSDDDIVYIPTIAQKVFDVSGAGDTVIAVIALGLACGMDIADACRLSNVAAGVVIGKVGTATLNVKELGRSWDKYEKL